MPILDSDNANISKVVLALAAVTEEVEQLTEAGSTRLLRPLLAFTEAEAGDTEVVLQKVPSEANPKFRNHGEGPY